MVTIAWKGSMGGGQDGHVIDQYKGTDGWVLDLPGGFTNPIDTPQAGDEWNIGAVRQGELQISGVAIVQAEQPWARQNAKGTAYNGQRPHLIQVRNEFGRYDTIRVWVKDAE